MTIRAISITPEAILFALHALGVKMTPSDRMVCGVRSDHHQRSVIVDFASNSPSQTHPRSESGHQEIEASITQWDVYMGLRQHRRSLRREFVSNARGPWATSDMWVQP